MDLSQLYSLRTDFTIIGLTGRTGSGCTMISKMLTSDFEDLKKAGLRDPSDKNNFDDPVFQNKYRISYNYLSHSSNWTRFDCINYKDVLLFIILKKIGKKVDLIKPALLNHFRENKEEDNTIIVDELLQELSKLITSSKHKSIINKFIAINKTKISTIKSKTSLLNLNNIFFSSEFNNISNDFFSVLEKYGYCRRTNFLHHIACNLRAYGQLKRGKKNDIKYVYSIAEIINRLIKARKIYNLETGNIRTKIVIDSLRNSLEIMFFKERYSGFYLITTKDVIGNSRLRVQDRLKQKKYKANDIRKITDFLFKLDETEYKTNDFNKGEFSSPDVENCIQKSDYHIINLKLSDVGKYEFQKNNFFSREEQLMKLISLIMQPGIITPSAVERCMQIANTAKLNSGCISRKVGAVITDSNFVVKSVGWNDVAKGQTPCNLRNVEDFLPQSENLENQHYSNFERSKNLSEGISYNYKGKTPGNFKEAMIDYYKDYDKNILNGKNCSFCFKTVHNTYEHIKNQVHTRSLHAEENAMLQLTKNGGQGVFGGILFTTASPCELCSKKAYQLGITKIYYIDPYPGIAQDQILNSGLETTKPIVNIFSGAVGSVYNRLYETFLSYKDEMSLTLK
jgi:dCMP deaminase